ncbi:MAG TPA: hypothetical protein VEV17_07845 [Bryobacteraceae bacterium]|nr:hypothetical protein [Bryobacteraceae bacterium]
MRLALALFLLTPLVAMRGQTFVDPSRTARIAKSFDLHQADKPLRCEVNLIPPQLNFSFRFQTGYLFRVPLSQYSGPGHIAGTSSRE